MTELTELATLLSSLDVVQLTLDLNDPTTLPALVEALGGCIARRSTGPDLVGVLKASAAADAIQITLLDHAAVSDRSGAASPTRDDVAGRFDWERWRDSLLSGSRLSGRGLADALVLDPAATLQGLHRTLHREATALVSGDADAAALDELAPLLATLGDELRTALLDATRAAPMVAEEARLLRELGEASLEMTFARLAEMDDALSRPARGAMMLCQKFSTLIAQERNRATRPLDAASFRAVLSDLLHAEDPADYTPDAYRTVLDRALNAARCARSPQAGAASEGEPAPMRHRAFESGAIGCQLARVCLNDLEQPAGVDGGQVEVEEARHRVQQHLLELLPAALGGADAPLTAALLRALPVNASSEARDDAAAAAASWMQIDLSHLLRAGDALSDEVDGAALTARLGRAAPQPLADEAVARVADDPALLDRAPVAALVEALIGRAAPELLEQLPPPLRLRVRGAMGFEDAAACLGGLLSSSDAGRRAEAFRALAAACDRWPAGVAARLLDDPDDAVRGITRAKVAGMPLGDRLEVLATAIEEPATSPDTLRLCVELLLEAGDAGESRLGDACRRACGASSPRRLRHAIRLLDLIGDGGAAALRDTVSQSAARRRIRLLRPHTPRLPAARAPGARTGPEREPEENPLTSGKAA